jgi:DNA uptake protein ComE-like DNA-binding protein
MATLCASVLMAINGVGEKGAAAVIKERAYGPFQIFPTS